MSTRIHNGYKLEGVRTLKEFDTFLTNLKKKVKVVQETLILSKVASLAAEFYDKRSLGWVKKKYLKKHKDQTPLTFAFMALMEGQSKIKNTGTRNPDFDFEFEVAFIFRKGFTLCTLYTEKPELVKVWESMKGVREYAYWDSTDRPKELSSAAWRKRRDDWGKAVRSSFADAGVVKTVTPPFLSWDDKDKILKAIPRLDRRLDCYARQMLIHSYPGERVLEDGSVDWSLVRKSMDFVRTGVGKKALINCKKNLKPRLLKRFSIKHLTQPVRSTLVRAV